MEAYPRPGRGENIEAPITPGIYEVRYAGTGALHSFEAVDNVAQALAQLSVGSKSWFGRRDSAKLPDLEYRTCATSSKADAKAAAQRMIGRRETYERRGLTSNWLKQGASAGGVLTIPAYTRINIPRKSEEYAMNPPVAARAHASPRCTTA